MPLNFNFDMSLDINPTAWHLERTMSRSAATLANLLILSIAGLAATLYAAHTDAYYRAVQEDQGLEWASFWAFLLAAVFYGLAARRQHRIAGALPWFATGISLFCIFVAMEEISWGQRILGYRPPDYFLEQNFQQELNVHNVFATDLRKLALKGVILGFGVVLPLATIPARVRGPLARVGISPPPWQLAPAFLGTYLLYELYPWSHTGEWVELMLGMGFLCAAVTEAWRWRPGQGEASTVSARPVLLALLGSVALGLLTTTALNAFRFEDPELRAVAKAEIEALRSDFLSGRVESRCSLHKRLYTFMDKYEQQGLLEGEFAGLVDRGLPDARAEFLLDPWNSPYWLRDSCRNGRRVTFVYSFGPDRARDSTRNEILGDDIGAFIRR